MRNEWSVCNHLYTVEQCVQMVVGSGPDSSLCFDSVSFQLSGISSDVPVLPEN